MTSLIGSEKQIKWAEKIKEQLLADTDIENTEISNCIDIDDINTEVLELFRKKIISCQDAKWFIEVKGTHLEDFEDMEDDEIEDLKL